ncbi:Uncharacterised protein [Mycobacteroides abscessus subsp. abscessus]|nr:Uncharacterised protein [Mycobacteroides abscessus subsp. abscessus]
MIHIHFEIIRNKDLYITDKIADEYDRLPFWEHRIAQIDDRIADAGLDIDVAPFIYMLRRFLPPEQNVFKKRAPFDDLFTRL